MCTTGHKQISDDSKGRKSGTGTAEWRAIKLPGEENTTSQKKS